MFSPVRTNANFDTVFFTIEVGHAMVFSTNIFKMDKPAAN